MEWYRDHVRPGMDEAKLAESFNEFAAAKNWATEQRDAAVSVYGQVRDQGPAAVMSPVINSYQSGRPSKVVVATVIAHLRIVTKHTVDLERQRFEGQRSNSLPWRDDTGAT
jgi:hypothetical protein